MFFLTLLLLSQSQEVKIKTPWGTMEMEVKESGGKVYVNSIIDDIQGRLERLQALIPPPETRLTRIRRRRILKLIKQISYEISLLPEEGSIILETKTANVESNVGTGHLPMSFAAFQSLVNQIKDEDFSDNQLNLISSAVNNNYFTVEQIGIILEYLDMEDTRLSALSTLWEHVIDTENGFKLLSKFSFSDNKEKAKEIMK